MLTPLSAKRGRQNKETPMKMHPSITLARISAAIKQAQATLYNPGFCVACGEECDGIEPDAREYECESCGESAVYGAEELLLEVAV